MICLICNQEFSNRTALCNHLNRKHNLKKQEYYNVYIKSENEGICKYNDCNNKSHISYVITLSQLSSFMIQAKNLSHFIYQDFINKNKL